MRAGDATVELAGVEPMGQGFQGRTLVHDQPAAIPRDQAGTAEVGQQAAYRFARQADHAGQVGLGQPKSDTLSAGDRLTELVAQVEEQACQPIARRMHGGPLDPGLREEDLFDQGLRQANHHLRVVPEVLEQFGPGSETQVGGLEGGGADGGVGIADGRGQPKQPSGTEQGQGSLMVLAAGVEFDGAGLDDNELISLPILEQVGTGRHVVIIQHPGNGIDLLVGQGQEHIKAPEIPDFHGVATGAQRFDRRCSGVRAHRRDEPCIGMRDVLLLGKQRRYASTTRDNGAVADRTHAWASIGTAAHRARNRAGMRRKWTSCGNGLPTLHHNHKQVSLAGRIGRRLTFFAGGMNVVRCLTGPGSRHGPKRGPDRSMHDYRIDDWAVMELGAADLGDARGKD